MTGAEAFDAVMERGTALALANGWRLARRRLMGADRVEIEGPADADTDGAEAHGLHGRDRLVADAACSRPGPAPPWSASSSAGRIAA